MSDDKPEAQPPTTDVVPDIEPPKPNPAERFKKWLQLLEAHGLAKAKPGNKDPEPERSE